MAATEDIIVALKVVGVNEVTKTLLNLAETLKVSEVVSQNAMKGFEQQFSSLKKSLAPLSASVRKSMIDGFVIPSQTADQAAEGIIKRQQEMTKFSAQFAQGMKEQGLQVQNVTEGLGQFKFEMLGVLFFGMAIQRLFSGLLRPSFDLVGVFKILQIELALFFLPTALEVQSVVLKLGTAMNNLPKPVQEAAGAIALIGSSIGGILLNVGLFSLGLDSMNRAFPKLNPALATFAKRFGPLGIGIGLAATSLGLFSDNSDKAKVNAGLLNLGLGGLLVIFGPVTGGIALIARIVAASGALQILLVAMGKFEAKFHIFERFKKFQQENFPRPGPESDPNLVANAVGGGVINQQGVTFNPTTNINVNVETTGGVDALSVGELFATYLNEQFSDQVSSLERLSSSQVT